MGIKGWLGLVEKRFDGDEGLAKEWLAQVGRAAYADNFKNHPEAFNSISTEFMEYRRQTIFKHPGSPETFVEERRRGR